MTHTTQHKRKPKQSPKSTSRTREAKLQELQKALHQHATVINAMANVTNTLARKVKALEDAIAKLELSENQDTDEEE